MTLQEALAILFDCGLPELEDNARDLAKQDDAFDGPPSAHPLVVQCREAIAVVRAAKGKRFVEVEAVGRG